MARIEIKVDPRKVRHVDPITHDFIGESPLAKDGIGIFVNGICSGYCDGPGKPINIIRVGLSLLQMDIEATVEMHYGTASRRIAFVDGIKE